MGMIDDFYQEAKQINQMTEAHNRAENDRMSNNQNDKLKEQYLEYLQAVKLTQECLPFEEWLNSLKEG